MCEYGWAAMALGNVQRVTFRDIEAAVDFDHLRAHYHFATAMFMLAPKEQCIASAWAMNNSPGYLARPSDRGLEEAGTLAALPLMQAQQADQ